MRIPLALAICLSLVMPAAACRLDSMIGWTLIARKTIDGRIDKGVKKDDFEGWPAPGSEDTELGVLMEPEVSHGETEVYAGVQA
jgi:hypothetical protein